MPPEDIAPAAICCERRAAATGDACDDDCGCASGHCDVDNGICR
jgi:hypothetical protein